MKPRCIAALSALDCITTAAAGRGHASFCAVPGTVPDTQETMTLCVQAWIISTPLRSREDLVEALIEWFAEALLQDTAAHAK